jgi:hypothetical protein
MKACRLLEKRNGRYGLTKCNRRVLFSGDLARSSARNHREQRWRIYGEFVSVLNEERAAKRDACQQILPKAHVNIFLTAREKSTQ